jgi:CDP-diacylglycerol--glycerol-3-phosphate 3-phosphatidyltransferase
MGKADRAFVVGLIALLLGLGVPTGTWLAVALVTINILLVTTIINRARNSLRGAMQ